MAKKDKRTLKEIKLISDIFETHGGIVEVSKKLNVSKQLVSIWKVKGYVPLSRVMEVASLLKVPPIALNYKALNKILGGITSWDTVTKDCYTALRLL